MNASTKFIVPTILLFFVDASEDLIMAKDATTSSNPFIVLVQDEELEKPPLDVNVSQWSHEEELIRRVVRTRVVQFVWDHRMLLNPHALAIYL